MGWRTTSTNLLQAIRTNFELLKRKPDDRALTIGLSERGIDITKRAARLTMQLLTFSRHQALDIRPVRIGDLLVGMEDLIRSTVGSQVRFTLDSGRGDPWVLADATQLEMAILN